MSATTMLQVNNLQSGYARGAHVLKGLDLQLDTGRTLAVMGRNGMGKTTLMRTLTGLLRSTSGQILFDGQDVAAWPTHRISRAGMAYVPQGREIFAGFSVLENIQLGALSHAQPLPDLDRLYAYFPILRERASQPAQTLSGGQQQMLAIARALAARPKLLLLDEPAEGIQPSIVQEIAAILRRINREEKLSILLVEQNLEMVRALADDVLFIENGKARERFPIETLRNAPEIFERNMGL